MSFIYPSNAVGCTNVLLIDNSVEDYQLFASSANSNTFPIIYSSMNSTKTELLVLLKTHFTAIERIGLVFIESVSNNFLDNQPFFNNEEATPYSDNVEFIISLINEFNIKNIDYLACNTLNYPNWANYYNILAKETTVMVGASNDRTGNIKYGGDWIMESTGQDIELIYFTQSIEYYQYLLDGTGGNTFIIKNGGVYGTGNNYLGQLGDGTNGDKYTLTPMSNFPSSKTPKYISCGDNHTIVLMTDGSVYGTGYNYYGQLGNGTSVFNVLTLTEMTTIPSSKKAKYISSGFQYTIVLMTDGSVYGTGFNSYGQLGIGITATQLTLVPMLLPTNANGNTKKAEYISCGDSHTIVLMTDGSLYGTGYNNYGQLGIGITDPKLTLVPMLLPTNANGSTKTPKYISCGTYHTIVLMTDGSLYGTGYNGNGQLGIGNTDNKSTLVPMNILSGKTPKYISCGQNHTIVLMTDGSIYGTGDNDGQLGIGNTFIQKTLVPMTIPDGKTPKYISCGAYHTIVLMTDGSVYGTGYNGDGRLGIGNTDNQSTLVPMLNASGVTYIMSMMDYDNIAVTDICFLANTPIQTDQGIIAIDQINPDEHTIDNKPIVDITKTINEDNYLICFKKDALGLNYPIKETVMSKLHKVYYEGHLREAESFVGEFENVIKINYNGEFLYNVLMKEHYKIKVNNLICETLRPDNLIAKLYTRNCKHTDKKRDKIVDVLREYKQKQDYIRYDRLVELC